MRMRKWCGVLALLAVVGAMLASPAAKAETGTLTEITDFSPNPGELQMFEYVPAGLPNGAPLVVFMHGCLSQVSNYDERTGWVQLAEERKWAIVFPQQRVTNNDNLCLNWTLEEDIGRGGGEAQSIVSMVAWMLQHHALDSNRVWVTGHSAGGYFTSVMLGTYPDVFAAGAEVSGGPYKCQTAQPIYLAPPGTYVEPAMLATEFSARDECTQAEIDKTPQQWGDLLRTADSAYTGPKRPILLWHGAADATVKPKNFHELIEQWTNFNGIDAKTDRHEDLVTAANYHYTHDVYADRRGRTLVETYLVDGADHPYPGDGSAACPGQANQGICATRVIADWFQARSTRKP
jgi:poly(hydroxyalkanoate) depolymerase family esterase